MGFHSVSQQSRVHSRMPDKERSPIARRESRFRLFDTHLCTSNFSSVSTNEVVHQLLSSELGNGRENSKGVTGQENDVRRVTADGRNHAVGLGGESKSTYKQGYDIFKGVGDASVHCQTDVFKINDAGDNIKFDILEYRSIPKDKERRRKVFVAPDGVDDFWFVFFTKIDGLRVAASLNVEDPIVGPNMLIVAD